jgi:hypothetical protein
MHGNEQLDVEDVQGIGKAIGVEFKGDKANMFSVLSRVGKGKQAKSGGDFWGGGATSIGC